MMSHVNISNNLIFLPRYPKIMTDEGIRVVRQWLGASNHLEEGECAHMLTITSPVNCVRHFTLPINAA